MDLGHSPDTGASEGELRSGYALTPSPSHSKNISLFTERRTSERAVSKDGYSSFLFNPLWGFTVVAAGILFVVDQAVIVRITGSSSARLTTTNSVSNGPSTAS